MIHLLREVQTLRQEGKLHSKLISRVRMLFIISAILAGVVIYNILFRAANPFIVLALAGVGFPLGLYVFSRMNVVNWNEEKEVIQAGRMDTIGYVTLVLYIGFEIGLRTFLKDFSPTSATAFLLAGIFGTLFGRAVGMLVDIHRVFLNSHSV